ncbi:autism susceptibility gene 2 protein isoform X1 [Lates japonicus]|uniref:Autism susceptibility gene 2 protein isoform X1 n=1 Tax=Lates japonicus TaxID=270547 RepID=A0AAD3MFH8_LATJO|nr:autism susceptibility gene 2 protein isoform X1 [Lates japonicus]
MDVIGIDMPWNAKVSLGFSQPSTPKGKVNSVFGTKEGPEDTYVGSPTTTPGTDLTHPPSFPHPHSGPKPDSVDRNRHSNRSSPASAPVSYQISSLIRSNSQNSSDSGRHHSGSVDRVREAEKELLERLRDSSTLADVKVKESRSPGKEMLERRPSEDSIKPTPAFSFPLLQGSDQ